MRHSASIITLHYRAPLGARPPAITVMVNFASIYTGPVLERLILICIADV